MTRSVSTRDAQAAAQAAANQHEIEAASAEEDPTKPIVHGLSQLTSKLSPCQLSSLLSKQRQRQRPAMLPQCLQLQFRQQGAAGGACHPASTSTHCEGSQEALGSGLIEAAPTGGSQAQLAFPPPGVGVVGVSA
jgi:hypothetical protein